MAVPLIRQLVLTSCDEASHGITLEVKRDFRVFSLEREKEAIWKEGENEQNRTEEAWFLNLWGIIFWEQIPFIERH